jgi:hypothetical protein
MAELNAYGLAVAPPAGWEGRIFRRPEQGEVESADVPGAPAPEGERTFPVVHVATIPLPMDAADYGSDVVEDLGRNDVLIVLKEFAPDAATSKLFAREGMPRTLRAAHFSPGVLQRSLPGLAGHQSFFHEADRAFCLYVVIGDHSRAEQVVPRVNAVLGSLTIERFA